MKKKSAREVNRLTAEQQVQLQEMPKYFYGPYGEQVDNPKYQSFADDINEAFKAKIDKINNALNREVNELTKFYKAKLAQFGSSAPGTNSEPQPKTGAVQGDSVKTNLYVHNYVNSSHNILPPPPLAGPRKTAKTEIIKKKN